MSELVLPEPALLREYPGDPAGRIPCPTVAQERLFGAKGRGFYLTACPGRHADEFAAEDLAALRADLTSTAEKVEQDNAGDLVGETAVWVPEDLQGQWRRQWVNAWQKGTRELVPALVDLH